MNANLARALVASAALHLALFAAWGGLGPRPTLGAAPAGPELRVRLGAAAGGAAAAADLTPAVRAPRPGPSAVDPPLRAERTARRRPRSHPRRRREPQPAVAAAVHVPLPAALQAGRSPRRRPSQNPVVVARRGGRSGAPAAAAGGGGSSAVQFVRAALLRLLGEHFDYPWIARREGWEGEVRLALRVGAGGRVSALRVVHTSGYPVLDRAALRSARRIRAVPDAAARLHGRAVEVVVPVEYRLVNG